MGGERRCVAGEVLIGGQICFIDDQAHVVAPVTGHT
jgi:hypothetical protein